jgi:hypothetical protein
MRLLLFCALCFVPTSFCLKECCFKMKLPGLETRKVHPPMGRLAHQEMPMLSNAWPRGSSPVDHGDMRSLIQALMEVSHSSVLDSFLC